MFSNFQKYNFFKGTFVLFLCLKLLCLDIYIPSSDEPSANFVKTKNAAQNPSNFAANIFAIDLPLKSGDPCYQCVKVLFSNLYQIDQNN